MTESKLEMRELRGDDVFTVLELVNALDMTDPISEIFREQREDIMALVNNEISDNDNIDDEALQSKVTQQVGYETIIRIGKVAITRIPKAKNEINKFLADVYQTDVQTVQTLPLKEYILLIKDFFSHKDFVELSHSVAELIG